MMNEKEITERLEEVLARISRPHADITWVGKNYSIQNLLDALEKLKEDL